MKPFKITHTDLCRFASFGLVRLCVVPEGPVRVTIRDDGFAIVSDANDLPEDAPLSTFDWPERVKGAG